MPTPVGHFLMGGICYSGIKKSEFKWSTFWLFILLANLPDLDYLPGAFMGAPNMFHHGITHSIGFSILAGIATGLGLRFLMKRNFWKPFLICTGVVFSHVLLDYLCADTSYPHGVPIFWPFSETYFISPILVFSDIYKGATIESFVMGLKETHNWFTVLREILVLAPIWGMLSLARWIFDTKNRKVAKT